jgi:hypothetical protein
MVNQLLTDYLEVIEIDTGEAKPVTQRMVYMWHAKSANGEVLYFHETSFYRSAIVESARVHCRQLGLDPSEIIFITKKVGE